jgi:hypothetical protein
MEKIKNANEDAIHRVLESKPVLIGLGIARDVIPGMKENLLLHAGPPISWEQMSGPMRGAVVGALIYEGKAKSVEEVEDLVKKGKVEFDSCHHHQAVGPMAGLISASMPVYIVKNATYGNRAFATLNEGYGKVLRYGAYDESVLTRLKWMANTLSPVLMKALELSGGIDVRNIIAQAIQMGDEGHNRNKATTSLFIRAIAPHLASTQANHKTLQEIFGFMHGNDLFMLNPVMAACKAVMDSAHNIPNSTLVTAMARNGTDFGIQVSGLGNRWFTAPSTVPQGLYFSGYSDKDANPDIGDSTITETAGIGGFAMAAAPAIVGFISGTAKMAMEATLEMYEITMAENKHYQIPALEFRGTPTGIDIAKVVELGIVPRVNTGIAHKNAGVGQIGAGLVRPPLQCFEDALVAFGEAMESED